YSYATLPKDVKNIPAHWTVLNTPVEPAERGLCEFRNITIENVEAIGARRIFSASGLPEKPLSNVKWANITVQGREAGSIEHARDWAMANVKLQTPGGEAVKLDDCRNVAAPEVIQK